MNSFNFQIVPVANLAAITTPFPDHICYFTEDTENYYIWENNALKEIFVDASSITWNNITNKPTTITGFGITDAVKVSNGTLNYVAKFTPDGTTIGNSQIQDNADTVSIGTTLDSNVKINISSNKVYGISLTNSNTSGSIKSSIVVSTTGVSSGENRGIEGTASGSTTLNVGIRGTGISEAGSKSVGGHFTASGLGTKYAIRLSDTTELPNKYLKCITNNGEANWGNINITEVTNGLSSTLLGAANGIATLDSNSKLTIAQMPISVMDYKGTYDIVTNTPNLVDGTGNQGDVYVCTTAGTRTFGVGNTITVGVGDWLIYNGTKWEKTLGNNVGAGTVTSVGLSLGTTGTDVNISNSPITSSGNINLNIPTASATARGLLSISDFNTFSGKQSVITLTTTGTSGAATFTGNTLNIPQYSAITLTTTGTSGAATLVGNTLNIPQYLDGSGTTDNVTFWTDSNTVNAASNLYYETNFAYTNNGSVTYGKKLRLATPGCASQEMSNGYYLSIVNKLPLPTSLDVFAGAEFVTRSTSTSNTSDSTITFEFNRIDSNINILSTQKDDALGKIVWTGPNQTTTGTMIRAYADELFSNPSSRGARIEISVTKKGTTSKFTSLVLDSDGYVKVSEAYKLPKTSGTANQFLKTNGTDADWNYLPDSAQIMCSDLVTSITASTTILKGFWIAPCSGRLTDIFASLLSTQQGGSVLTVQVKMNGSQVALPVFANLTTLSSTIVASNTFTKGTIFEIFVTQVGDGTAKGLLTTINYERT
jgi:hypothetical protein